MGTASRLRSLVGCLACGLLLSLLGARVQLQSLSLDAQLLGAATHGNVRAVAELLAKGANVDAASNYRITPLFLAADKADLELVRLLLDHGADPNIIELQWGRTPLRAAAAPWNDVEAPEARAGIVELLVEKHAGIEGDALAALIRGGYIDAARTVISRDRLILSYANLALAAARRVPQAEMIDLLIKAGARDPGPADRARSPERLKLLAGIYRGPSGEEITLDLSRDGSEVMLERGEKHVSLFPAGLRILKSIDLKVVVSLNPAVLPPAEVSLNDAGRSAVFTRIADIPARTAEAPPRPSNARETRRTAPAPPSSSPALAPPMRGWPSFRGAASAGVAGGSHPPIVWDLAQGTNIQWKTPIPGLAHSSPVIWGDRVFITTAVPISDASLTFRHGETVGVASTREDVPYSWRVYAVDKQSGKILWERVAHEGIPQTARHVMASQANQTPATDGTHLVVWFGSEGLFCYDFDGHLLWRKDFGPLASGRVQDPSYQWNTASSPVIYRDLVILQVDLIDSAFIVALDIKTGRQVWGTERDEWPSWSTPLLLEGLPGPELVTAASKFARGYDPDTGKERWRLAKHSVVSIPTPVAGRGLIFITSGGGSTIQPIYAVRQGATGDITLNDNEESNEFVAWSTRRGGAHITTPILYGDLLYVCSDGGVLAAYQAETGERVYRERVTRGSRFSASPVVSDGKLYFSSEDGDVVVVKAGPQFERLAVNSMGELIMATPAISEGMILVRTQHHLVAVAESTPE